MPRTSKSTTNINQYTGYSRPKRIEIMGATDVSDATNKSATDAADVESEQIIASLWDRTFTSYMPEMVIKMPYYFQRHVNQAPGIQAANQFKINSLYDFDLTGVGHQPLGRDTWAGIYDYYKVLETRVEVTWHTTQYITGTVSKTADSILTDANAGPGYMAPAYVGAMLDITANPPPDLTTWHEAQRVTGNTQQRFSEIKVLERTGSRSGNRQSVTMRWTPELFDTAIINDATQNTWTPVGSDPGNLNYLSAIVHNTNSTANNIHYSLEVKATMLVAFKNVNRTLLVTTN